MSALLENPTRRGLIAGAGALVVSFQLTRAFAQEATPTTPAPVPPPQPARLPGSLDSNRMLDAWIRIDAEGKATVFTGKAELGQGIRTALRQVAAEELELPVEKVEMITADTGRTPNEGYTAGSQSMPNSGTAIRNAAAQVRALLIGKAAEKLGVEASTLRAENGVVIGEGGAKLGYGELVSDELLHVEAQPQSVLKAPKDFKLIGQDLQRIDIPGKVTGGLAYVQDLRLPGMVHARVVRPPGPGATLKSLDSAAVEKMKGVLKVVRDGSYLAVIAEREFQAVKAMRALAAAAEWDEKPTMPKSGADYETITALPATDLAVRDKRTPPPSDARRLEARYTRPYQMHGSIGPSCAVGEFKDDLTTVWTHTQGVYPDRMAISQMLGVPQEKVRLIHMEGSGCYGHNGADDAAADAALLARALPGRPVRVQFMREQEHAWEPYGPAMVTSVKAALGADGRIADWDFEVWSNPHATRPGPAGSLIGARYLEKPFTLPPPPATTNADGSGDRNAVPLYDFQSLRVIWHFLADMPVRVSALRALGAYMNVYSIETFMDELADAAGTDPVAFRLKHLKDERAIAVVKDAAERFGWGKDKPPAGRGHGFAFARYKNSASFCAVACEVEVNRSTGRVRPIRYVASIDSGEAVSPTGIRNQTEGGILQATSWTLYEEVAHDESRIHSVDWSTYPILRFGAVPDTVEVNVIPRPGAPFLGAGEAAQGPTGAALGNAVARAIGKRMRDLPLTAARVKAALG